MPNEYVYILVEPKSSNHPMNKILAVGHHLYEVKFFAMENNLDFNKVEVWRMRSGEKEKNKLSDWLERGPHDPRRKRTV